MDYITISTNDNVATALRDCKGGDILGNVVLLESIKSGHKFALQNIMKGDLIIKYGEAIGKASCNITKGEHVHIHNIEGIRGRGDLTQS